MAELFTNPGFESGLNSWTALDSGNRAFSTTTTNPIADTTSAKPVIGGPGWSVLYQTITVPADVTNLDVSFQITSSFNPRGAVDAREKVRVDLLSSDADVENETANVIANLFTMTPQDSNITTPQTVFADLTSYAGRTITFRIYVADYQGPANFAFDNITTALSNPANNTAPTLDGLPLASWDISTGQDVAFPQITVDDVDGNTLILTINVTGGTVDHVVDADANTPGIQLTGTAADINLALSSATFKATTAGSGQIDFSLSDGTAAPVLGSIAIQATTPPPPSSPEPSPPPPAPPVDVAKAFAGVLGDTLSAEDAAKIQTEIARGDYTFNEYVTGLIAKAQDTSVPALVVSNFLRGTAPDQAHMAELIDFAKLQFAAYSEAGSSNPTLGVYEALGLGSSNTAMFQMTYGELSDDVFVKAAYQAVFSRAATVEQTAHFDAQISYFEQLYAGAGQSAALASLHAKGAVIGQMLGHAVLDDAAHQVYDDQANAFLRDASLGKAGFGEPLGMI